MTRSKVVIMTAHKRLEGSIETTSWPLDNSKSEVLVQLNDGRELLVPARALSRQEDGGYILNLDAAELERRSEKGKYVRDEPLTIPIMVEEIEVQKRQVETDRIRISKVVHERQEIVDEPLFREEVTIERVPINRVVDETIPVRYEGDTMIVSLLEEVVVVEKRLMLKEELRITKHRIEVREPMRVILRSEEATVEHRNVDDKGPHPRGDDNG